MRILSSFSKHTRQQHATPAAQLRRVTDLDAAQLVRQGRTSVNRAQYEVLQCVGSGAESSPRDDALQLASIDDERFTQHAEPCEFWSTRCTSGIS
jgi:hypothetical protein